MVDLKREYPLFDKYLPIQVHDGIHETRNSNLVCRILHGTQPTATVGQLEKVFHFEITDERDPYFLYYMDVGEQDFHHLKRDQSILVEFNVFPSKLIELIDLCLRSPSANIVSAGNNTNDGSRSFLGSGASASTGSDSGAGVGVRMAEDHHHDDNTVSRSSDLEQLSSSSVPTDGQQLQEQPRQRTQPPTSSLGTTAVHVNGCAPVEDLGLGVSSYSHAVTSTFVAKLDTSAENGTGVFSVIEANKFKQLTHISLVLTAGDDDAIKRYLASRLKLALNVASKQASGIVQLETHKTEIESQNRCLLDELHQLKTRSNVDSQSLRSQHAQEISQAQMQAMETIEGLRARHEEQLESVRAALERAQNELHEKTNNYEQQISDLNFSKGQLEFKLRDVERLLQNTVSDRDRLIKEWDAVNENRREVETDRTELQREAVRLEARVDKLTAQLEERDKSMAKTVELQQASDLARASMEQRLQMYISNAEVLQDNLKAGAAEIDKGNEIIAGLQAEVRTLRDKVKTKSEVIRKQEAAVGDLRVKVVDSDHQLAASRESLRSAEQKIDSLQQQLAEAHERIEDSNRVITGNQEVITYLNEEINKWQLGMRITADPGMEHLPAQVHSAYGAARGASHSAATASASTGSVTPIPTSTAPGTESIARQGWAEGKGTSGGYSSSATADSYHGNNFATVTPESGYGSYGDYGDYGDYRDYGDYGDYGGVKNVSGYSVCAHKSSTADAIHDDKYSSALLKDARSQQGKGRVERASASDYGSASAAMEDVYMKGMQNLGLPMSSLVGLTEGGDAGSGVADWIKHLRTTPKSSLDASASSALHRGSAGAGQGQHARGGAGAGRVGGGGIELEAMDYYSTSTSNASASSRGGAGTSTGTDRGTSTGLGTGIRHGRGGGASSSHTGSPPHKTSRIPTRTAAAMTTA